MAKRIDQPCKDGLSAACFAQEPNFAKRAFSFRLLNAFVPPKLSRRLLTFLGLIRFDPAGNLPEWLNLPPWWIILPGAIIPPGWKFGDPLFDGLFIPPIFGPEDHFSNPFGPWHLTPGGSGPTRANNFGGPSVPPWFYDGFISLDLAIWQKWLEGTTTIALDGLGSVKFTSSDPNVSLIKTAHDNSIPDRWILSFRVKVDSHSGNGEYFYIEVFSGSHAVKFQLKPPVTINHATGGGSTELTVPNYVGGFHTYSLKYDAGYTDLYQDGVLLHSNQHHQHVSGHKGEISIWVSNTITCRLDYISLDEY